VTIAKRPSYRARDGADDASGLGRSTSHFPKIGIDLLRQIGTTGNLSMARMRDLPVEAGQESKQVAEREQMFYLGAVDRGCVESPTRFEAL
jgi:hypothetical protein